MFAKRLSLRKAMSFMLVVGLSIGFPSVSIQAASAYENQQILYPERGYWRIIDKTGKFVFEKRFERSPVIQDRDILGAEYSTSNRYESDLHYFSHDFSGKRLRELVSDPNSLSLEDGISADGLTLFKEDGFYGYLDESGKKVIPARFRNGFSFDHGYAFVPVADGLGLMDKTGRLAWTSKDFSPKLNDLNMAVVNIGSRYFAVQYITGQESPQFIGWFEGDELYHSVQRAQAVSKSSLVLSGLAPKSGIALRKDGTYRDA